MKSLGFGIIIGIAIGLMFSLFIVLPLEQEVKNLYKQIEMLTTQIEVQKKEHMPQKIERIVEYYITDFYESGIASWYGEPEHGRKTAGGTTYNMYEFTCAHRNLPFGTIVLVTNKKNGKSIKMVVTDRMPDKWIKVGRVIDVSLRSAEELGFVREGLVKVDIKILRKELLE